MRLSKTISIIISASVCIAALFGGCSSDTFKELSTNLADVGNKILGNSGNQEKQAYDPETEIAVPNDLNTVQMGETFVICEGMEGELEITPKSINVYDSLEAAGIAYEDLSSFALETVINSSGEMSDGHRLVLFEFDGANMGQDDITNDALLTAFHMGAYELGTGQYFDEEEFASNLAEEMELSDEEIRTWHYASSFSESAYFYFVQTETATRSAKESEYYHYSLAQGETAAFYLGWIVSDYLLSHYDCYIFYSENNVWTSFMQIPAA
ncbi:MAG: hypothetical protein LUH40_08670 [Clostridiales bacterium]|nr:hypothetical protein [Clostridiales bacterium]